MVLEDISEGPNDTMNDAPASDVDPYSPPSSSERHDGITLPRPVPIFGPTFGYNEEAIGLRTRARIRDVQNTLRRRATREEADAAAYWSAKYVALYSYGVPIGMAGGVYRAWTTRRSFQFPFYKPNPQTFNPLAFPPKLGLITGSRATMIWHTLRGGMYAWIGKALGTLFFGSYAVSVCEVGMRTDLRLQAYIESKGMQTDRSRGEVRDQRPESHGRQPSHLPRGTARQPSSQRQQDNDASPTWGPYEESAQNTGYETGVSNDSVVPEQRRLEEERRQPRPVKAQSHIPPTQEGQSDRTFDFFEKTSPDTAFEDDGQGSTWERIRRGEKSGNTETKKQRKERRDHSKGDDFTFSKTKEEHSYAKGEAQKAFDARIENERNGKDFGSGDQRDWK